MTMVGIAFSVVEGFFRKHPTAGNKVYEFVRSAADTCPFIAGGLVVVLFLLYAAIEVHSLYKLAKRHGQRGREELRNLLSVHIQPTLDYVDEKLLLNWRENNFDNFCDSAKRVRDTLKNGGDLLKGLIDKIRSNEEETRSKTKKVIMRLTACSLAGGTLCLVSLPLGLSISFVGVLATVAVYVWSTVEEYPLKEFKELAGDAQRVRLEVEASCTDIDLKVAERIRTREVPETPGEVLPIRSESARETDRLESIVALLAGYVLGIFPNLLKWIH